MTKREKIKCLFSNLITWERRGERAPHKPLLVLYALARTINGERLIPYADIKNDLKCLLEEFGPPRKVHHPNYPFVRLSNDGIWDCQGLRSLDSTKDWSDRALLDNQSSGGFTEEIYFILLNDWKLVCELAEMLLEQNFPNTIHDDILQAVGLDTGFKTVSRRDPHFRDRILKAYEYRCAVCGFNVRLGQTLVAVEAAHIKWHQAGGPDQEENGIALCTMHHKLFDRGVFTINQSLQIHVAEAAHGTEGFEEWLMRYHGKGIRHPQRPQYKPGDSYIGWHVKEVFRGPARNIVG